MRQANSITYANHSFADWLPIKFFKKLLSSFFAAHTALVLAGGHQ